MRAYWPHISLFLLGLILVPSLITIRYSITFEADSSIRLRPKAGKGLLGNFIISDASLGTSKVTTAQEICARNRWIIKKAVSASGEKSLNLFGLISRGLLKEMPNCPDGGSYNLKDSKDIVVECGSHGFSKVR